MDLEVYNQSFDEALEDYEAEADHRLQVFRQQCVNEFIEKLNRRQREWDIAFQTILSKCIDQEDKSNHLLDEPRVLDTKLGANFGLNLRQQLANNVTVKQQPDVIDLTQADELPNLNTTSTPKDEKDVTLKIAESDPKISKEVQHIEPSKTEPDFADPRFSNFLLVNDYLAKRKLSEHYRTLFDDIITNPSLKSLKNEYTIFIRTQINSISNSDAQHLATKILALTNLFKGENVSFQGKLISANHHPQGRLFCMDSTAQTFVTVGTRLANSVPAIAKSMATVINGIIDNNFPEFRDLVIVHLHERCPYLVPMYPKQEDFSGQSDTYVKYMIACGYAYDAKTQTLESEEKYMSRLRSMVLIFTCVLAQKYPNLAWSWLIAFLSLKPQPVITATVLQAFLQEASKKLSLTYGRQYTKVLEFIKKDYLTMIEAVTPKTSERQSLIKLKNLLSDNTNLISAPSVGSIFGAMRYA